jgi:hypothetical protein
VQATAMHVPGIPEIAPSTSQNPNSESMQKPSGHVAAGFGFVHATRKQTNTINRMG